MRVLVKSISMFHGQRRTLTTLNLRSEHKYSFEKLSAVFQDAFTMLNNNGKNHSDNRMVRKVLKKIKVTNSSEMYACKFICSSMHG